MSATQWREELTAVLTILTQLADTDDLGEIGDESAAAFDCYVAAGRNRRHFMLWRSSADPAMLAAVVPAAVELLIAPSPTEFDEGLAPFVTRAFETRFPTPHELHRNLGVGGATLQAWARILGDRQSLTTRLRFRFRGTETRPGRLAFLPQMLLGKLRGLLPFCVTRHTRLPAPTKAVTS